MGIDSPFGWRGGSGGGIVLFELLDGHFTQEFVDVGRKEDGARRPSGGGSASRRGRGRLRRGNGGDMRRPSKVGSVEPGRISQLACQCHHRWCLRRSNPGDRGCYDGQEIIHVGRQL